jgi:hypothetical protein
MLLQVEDKDVDVKKMLPAYFRALSSESLMTDEEVLEKKQKAKEIYFDSMIGDIASFAIATEDNSKLDFIQI